MARKIVAIHGIGNIEPGWSESLRVDLDIPAEDWIEFHYDDLMDRSFFNRVVVSATKIYLSHTYGPEAAALASGAEDYINDLISYFVMNGTRLEIQVRLKGILRDHPDAIILGHSLGSVIAYETLKNFELKAHTFFTLGSPLSKFLVKKFLKVPEKTRPNVTNWFNIWGTFDPISGRIDGLGCTVKDQFKIKNSHNLLKYVDSQKARILSLYNETVTEGILL
ncbi:MAG: DDHD family phospholipase [Cyanobacteria bacterium]|nr:DDHD family phospholipase [Cyanobacteriota bacterium]